MTPEQSQWFADSFQRLVANVEIAILGKTEAIQLALTTMLSEGHLLLEDVPGTGKTMLAKALANTVQGSHHRIQFTPDLLPGDITGVSIFDQRSGNFEFHPGPIFATVVLADEVNRASPKTQSALLEVMEEGRVSVDGVPHPVGEPFMVIATQNPVEDKAGTYRLPEAQLDRFMMKTSIGYPSHDRMVELMASTTRGDRSASVEPVITAQAVVDMAELAATVHVDDALMSYITRLAEQTRRAPEVKLGVSVRGCLSFLRAAKTWAASQGRNHVVPDDIKALAVPLMSHRVMLHPEAEFSGASVEGVIARVMAETEAPDSRTLTPG